VVLLQLATKNHAVTLTLLPPTQWDGKENQMEKKAKTHGLGKGQFNRMAKGEENNSQ